VPRELGFCPVEIGEADLYVGGLVVCLANGQTGEIIDISEVEMRGDGQMKGDILVRYAYLGMKILSSWSVHELKPA